MKKNLFISICQNRLITLILLVLLSGLFISCHSTGNDDDDDTAMMDLTLRFDAVVGAKKFECGQNYVELGSTKTTAQAIDFRFYVSNVRLMDTKGHEIKAELIQDNKWQNNQVALLDFENQKGFCSNGTPEINTSLKVRVPAGFYKGLRFTLGIPFEQNHQDAAKATSPLNVTAMFWIWNSGYKFAKIDFRTTGLVESGQGAFNIHVGSTGCTPSIPAESVPTSCSNGNRAEIELTNFDPLNNTVVADYAELVKNTNLDSNVPNTAPGCMSGLTDTDCNGIFPNLGMSFGNMAAGKQLFFKIQ